MKPIDRDAVIRFAERRQTQGDLLAWSIDEDGGLAEFLVPLDSSPDRFPTTIRGVKIHLVWLPRPEELSA